MEDQQALEAAAKAEAAFVPNLKKGFLDAPAPKPKSKKAGEPMVSLKGTKSSGMGGNSSKVIPGETLNRPVDSPVVAPVDAPGVSPRGL